MGQRRQDDSCGFSFSELGCLVFPFAKSLTLEIIDFLTSLSDAKVSLH
jgi:hypothetical protein